MAGQWLYEPDSFIIAAPIRGNNLKINLLVNLNKCYSWNAVSTTEIGKFLSMGQIGTLSSDNTTYTGATTNALTVNGIVKLQWMDTNTVPLLTWDR
jgi:hypothetical protein